MGCAACIYRLSRLPLGVSVAAFETAFSFARPGSSTGSTRLYSTNFQPAPPPGTHGTPVFPNIDFAVATEPNSESQKRNSDPGAVFVVSGSNRGIGLQFVKSLTERSKGTIVALCRTPASATSLNNYIASSQHDRIQVVQLDLENQSSIANAGKEIRDKYQRVDLLLNVAGILGDGRTTPGPERSLAKLNRDWLQKTLAINLVGPAMLSKELLPLLLRDRRKQKDSSRQQRPTAIVANLSARVGSIADNGLGGWYSYRMSKSAMNQYTRTLALELKRHSAWTVALHPGTTDTDLSVPFQANVKEGSLFPVEFTVNQLLDVIDSMTEEYSGGFYDWSGQSLSF
ncbi:hypothetical protein MPSEU_000472000 [Mayamaea pseudoterrestris]|nr:hypothetical protein MPSEU_000472000 [Mayamaea pseudoterrestris]